MRQRNETPLIILMAKLQQPNAMPNERLVAEQMLVYFLSKGARIESLDEVSLASL